MTTVEAHLADIMAGFPRSFSKLFLLSGLAPSWRLEYLNTCFCISLINISHSIYGALPYMSYGQWLICSTDSFWENIEFLGRRDKCGLCQYPFHLPWCQMYSINSVTVSTLKAVEYKNRSSLICDSFRASLYSLQWLLSSRYFLSEQNKFKPLTFRYSVTCS